MNGIIEKLKNEDAQEYLSFLADLTDEEIVVLQKRRWE